MLQMDEELYLAAMMAYEDEIRHAVVAGKGWINEKVLSLDAGRTKLQWLHDANYIICGDPGEVPMAGSGLSVITAIVPMDNSCAWCGRIR